MWGWDATNEVWVKCVVNEDGKLIINPTGFLENPPTEDEAAKAPTSEWAFDHDADPDAHHEPYTDAEAVNAAHNRSVTIDDATVTDLDVTNISTIYADTTSNGVYFYGLAEGVTGKMVRIVKYKRQNQVRFYDNSTSAAVGDRILTSSDVNEFLFTGSVGTCVLIYLNGYWIQERYMLSKYSDIIQDTPANGVVSQAITRNWAYDHLQLPNIHHTKYTDAEAVFAFYTRNIELDNGEYTSLDCTDLSYISLNPGSGDIDLKGMDNGTYGQMIFFSRLVSSNVVTIYHNSGDAPAGDKIYTSTSADVVMSDYGTFYMIYIGGVWICSVINSSIR